MHEVVVVVVVVVEAAVVAVMIDQPQIGGAPSHKIDAKFV
jgi:hypothetical protein